MKKNATSQKGAQIKFEEGSLWDLGGTSFHHGIVKGSANKLTKVLGQPMVNFNDKTNFQWIKKFGSITISVYDYREYPSRNKVIEFHIGTHCESDTFIAVELLKRVGLDAYIEERMY